MISSEVKEKITKNQMNKNIKSGNKQDVIEAFHISVQNFKFSTVKLKYVLHALIIYQLLL